MIATVLGGIGLFLLGMALMTDGLKALAGEALRRVLTRFVGGPFSGMVSGAAATALVQSSSATTLTTIGFVSAGLLTFPQAVGVIFGANLGTTSTGWLVSLVGFKVSISAAALPMVFVGAMLRLFGRERVAAGGLALAGLGLLFVGINMLQSGMAGLADRISPADLPSMSGFSGMVLLVLLGMVMTVVMQSSSAAVTTTLAALHSGTITLEQAAVMVVGQNIGTTVTAGIAAIGASIPAKRTALAHILFNVLTGAVAMGVLPLFVSQLERAERMLGPGQETVFIAAFHTAFNVLGVVLLLPFADPFSTLITRLIRQKGPQLTRHLDVSVARLGSVAVEAARRTVLEIAALVVQSVQSVLRGESRREAALSAIRLAEDALAQTRRFVAGLGAAPQMIGERRRHLSTLHAIDHVSRLVEACEESGPPRQITEDPELADLVQRLVGVLDEARRWFAHPHGAAAVALLEQASTAIAEIRRAERPRTLERTAAGRIDPDTALKQLEAMRWIDRLAYHVWRSALHLQEKLPEQAAHAEVSLDPPTKLPAAPEKETPSADATAPVESVP